MLEPQRHTLETIIGHGAAKAFLLKLLASGRLPPVVLLEGPDALGKRSFALAAAKAVLSAASRAEGAALRAPGPARMAKRSAPPPPDDDGADLFAAHDDLFGAPAGEPEPDLFGAAEEPPPPAPPPAPAPEPQPRSGGPLADHDEPRRRAFEFLGYHEDTCRRIEASYPPKYNSDGQQENAAHPDLSIIEPAGNSRSILAAQIDALHDIVRLAPIQSHLRLVLLFGADTITTHAANSMLKLLEEPPAYLHFIMVTDHPHGVLPTIRSRACRVPFHPLPVDELAERLVESEGLARTLARTAAVFAEGRPGVALRAAAAGGAADSLLARRRDIFEARRLVDRYGAAGASAAASRIAAAKLPADDTLRLLLCYARDRLVSRHAADRPELLVNGDLPELLPAERADSAELLEEAERLLAAMDALGHPFLPNTQALYELALWPE
ncbi:MAG: hypothetical protein SF028_15345 [Candidatus Sumerlaeia bacterium]|nr:hypothetical protein [Candidatus Sumerlaeia bacterium]